jgi:hypothetical protein
VGDLQTEVSSQPERNSVEEDNRKISSRTQSKEGSSDGDGTKDYVHMRAKRGQATNSHSLAERVNFSLVLLRSHFSSLYVLAISMVEVGCNSSQMRRKKISERMKLLQDLVPGCSKVTFFFLS